MKEVIQVENQYYILAAAAHDERTRVLKHGDTFALFDRAGNIRALGLRDQGLYHEGTRFLSRLELRMGGLRPLLLSSSVVEDNMLLAVDLTNPDIRRDGELIPRGALHLFRAKLLLDGACHERIHVRNYGSTAVDLELALEIEADFQDIFEVRGTARPKRGAPPQATLQPEGVDLTYTGLDSVRRTTRIASTPSPSRAGAGELAFQIHIEPGEEQTFFITIQCLSQDPGGPRLSYEQALARSRASLDDLVLAAGRIRTSNEMFNEWLERSIADLRMMITQTPAGPYPYAGVPWYSTAFGRDGIITALQALWWQPSLAAGVLRFLAAHQARELEPERDAEPGKILHEMRRGEMAALGEIPFGRYYGTVDATPLYLILAGEYYRATGDRALIEQLWPNLELALSWLDKYGDLDGDGFVEYQRRASRGLDNHGWKDSFDSVFHQDGRLAEGPIALCEVQAYVYAARQSAAALAAMLGQTPRAEDLRRQARALRSRFERAFWCEELSTYALALDGEKRACLVSTSNAGHCLFGGIASDEHARQTARTLSSPAFLSGWGIRTVAETETRYNPMSYHNGSVWPHDNALIAAGFARYGFRDLALAVLESMYEASLYFAQHRMPELFCGFVRRPGEGPTLYPVACLPQAWASGAVLMLLQACLGLRLDGPNRRLYLHRPLMPAFLDKLYIDGLRVGDVTVALELFRYPAGAGVHVVQRTGALEVLVIK